MPLTIRELHVKMVVEDNDREAQISYPDQRSDSGHFSEDRLIEKCVETVLQILEDKNEA